jgi:hypothetical protein
MKTEAEEWVRREFLRDVALAGTAGLVGLRPERALADPPPVDAQDSPPQRARDLLRAAV